MWSYCLEVAPTGCIEQPCCNPMCCGNIANQRPSRRPKASGARPEGKKARKQESEQTSKQARAGQHGGKQRSKQASQQASKQARKHARTAASTETTEGRQLRQRLQSNPKAVKCNHAPTNPATVGLTARRVEPRQANKQASRQAGKKASKRPANKQECNSVRTNISVKQTCGTQPNNSAAATSD